MGRLGLGVNLKGSLEVGDELETGKGRVCGRVLSCQVGVRGAELIMVAG